MFFQGLKENWSQEGISNKEKLLLPPFLNEISHKLNVANLVIED